MRTHGAPGQFIPWRSVLLFVMAMTCAGRLAAQTASVETLHSFLGPTNDGEGPDAALTQGNDGNFYGTTEYGGSSNCGTVFKITPAGVLTTLYSFTNGTDGRNPEASVTQGSDGNFYGTTCLGGDKDVNNGYPQGSGTLFKITPDGVLTTLYDFTGGADGTRPQGALTQGSDGNFYGTTYGNDAHELYGTVFKITPAGVLTTLYTFTNGTDGAFPAAGVTQGSDGNFYGTTFSEETGGAGTVFKITPAGVLTTLYTFTGGTDDGANPEAALTQGSDGNFYGTTVSGGIEGDYGTIFKITPAGVLTIVYRFTDGTDGANPQAALTQGSDGNFYGTTSEGLDSDGDSNGDGAVFKITPAGVLTTLYTFTGGADGSQPQAGLTQGTDGSFYGTTFSGGQNNLGVVYRFTFATTAAQPVVTSQTASAQVGSAFSFQIVATNGPTSFGASGLPSGLSLDNTTGVISGTPTQSGTFSVSLYATNAVGTGTATLSLAIAPAPLPIVTLMATIPEVSAETGDIGEFTVSLSAPQTSDVIVSYTIKGSAINGTDYVTLSGTKKIKAGKTSKPIKIIPQGDLGGASKKVVTLVLNPADGYTIGTTGKVKVKILSAGQ